MACLNDFVEPGKVFLVGIKLQNLVSVANFENIDEALKVYSDKYYRCDSLNQLIEDGRFDIDADKEFIDKIKNDLKSVGIDENTPFYEVEGNYIPEYKYRTINSVEKNKLSFLIELASDDNNTGVYVAREDQTYKELIDEIYNDIRHVPNAPLYSYIQKEFYLEDNSFDLNKIAEENEWVIKDVKRFGKDKKLLIGDFVFELDYNENRNKDFVNNFKQSLPKSYVLEELQKWNENQEEITFCYGNTSFSKQIIAKNLNELAKQYPDGSMGFIVSAYYNNDKSHLSSATLDFIEKQMKLIKAYDVSVSKPLYSCKDFYDDLEKNLKESFPHNYESKNVGEEFIREVNFLFQEESTSISSKTLAALALRNVLIYEEDNKNIHNETKNDLLSNFFKTQKITNEKEFVSFVEKIIENTKEKNLAIQKQAEAARKKREAAEAKQQSHDNALNEAKELLESGTIKESKRYFELQEKLDSTPSKKAGNYRKRKQKLLVKTFMEHLSKTSKNKLLPEVEAKYLQENKYERGR